MAAHEPKRIVILDTHAILHRAYHALPDFSSSKGEPTGALYGLVSMLARIVADLKPDYIVAAFDLPGETFRHAAYDGYKATRRKAEDDLVRQLNRARDVLDVFGVPRLEKAGYEADDIIGTLAVRLKKDKNLDIIIASGDMDTLQLVDGKQVRVFTLKKGLNDTTLYDEAGVKARYGFDPEQLPDYKGLRGDPSDNIPGVAGIGEKTATDLIVKFETVEKLYSALKRDPQKVIEAGVRQNVVDKLVMGEEKARMSKELALIHTDVPVEFELPEQEWSKSVDREGLLAMLSEFEFRSLIPRVKELLAAETRRAERENGEETTDTPDDLFSGVAELPQEAKELAIAVWVLDSNVTEPTLDDVWRVGKSRDLLEAKKNIEAELKKKKLEYVYEKIELPLMPVLRRMEERGVLVDKDFLAELSREYNHELQTLAKRIYKHAGGEFNINSPRQLGEVLFDKLGLSVKNHKKTAGGARSTRESELQKFKNQHPIVEDILSYRELAKLLGTYIDAIPKLLDGNNRLHTTFIQTGTTTGRLASKDPNLQNIPIKTDAGRKIRHAFVASKGFELLSFDYSQIELRIAAILSGDEGLCGIFKEGRDVHAEVAARVFGVESGDVTYEQRRRAKVINFGILYGMGVSALQQSLGTSRVEAQDFYNQYFAAFPRLAEFMEEVKADAHRQGFTTTMFGRRRYFEGIRSPIPYVRAAAERMAINAPLQGTQSDVVKLAMIRIDELFEREGLRDEAHLLLQVHDELIFEIKKEKVPELAPKIKALMEEVIPRKELRGVPLVVEGKTGKSWGDMQEL